MSWTRSGEARALHLHPVSKAGHRLGIVLGLEDGLGQQRQPADRCLELVADVDDEVATGLLDPSSLGAVVHEQQHVLAAQRGHPSADRDPATPQGAARQIELDLPDDPVAADLSGQMTQLVVDQVVIADQAVSHGPGAGADDGIGGVQDNRPRTQDGQHRGHTGRQGARIRRLRHTALRTLGQAHQSHTDGAGDQPEHAAENCRSRGVHDTQRTHERTPRRAISPATSVRPPSVHLNAEDRSRKSASLGRHAGGACTAYELRQMKKGPLCATPSTRTWTRSPTSWSR